MYVSTTWTCVSASFVQLLPLMVNGQVAVYRAGIRTTEFFKDFDHLRSGRITERQFLSALRLAVGKEAHIMPEDGERIVGFYRCLDGSVDYREFCEMLENAFNIPHLDKKPTQAVARPPTGALGRVLPILTEQEEKRADDVLEIIRTEVISLVGLFSLTSVVQPVRSFAFHCLSSIILHRPTWIHVGDLSFRLLHCALSLAAQ